jgi:hypothetical protein
MNTPPDYECSPELAEAKGRHLAVQTNSRMLGWSSLLALLVGSATNLAAAREELGSNVAIFDAVPATNESHQVRTPDQGSSISAELMRVFVDLASRQVEMDDVAKGVLYSRMQDLYRR